MTRDLLEKIDGAKAVKHAGGNLIHVWHGGHGVHVYDHEGNEVHFYNVGSFKEDEADRSEVIEAMEETISGDHDE